MSIELQNIFSKSGESLTEAQIAAYLDGQLSETDARAVELLLSEDGPDSDAIEGLQGVSSMERSKAVLRVRKNLKSTISANAKKKTSLYKPGQWNWVIAFVVLLLIIVGWVVIEAMKKN